jgi:isoleucyl-tRNA synthetase
MTAREYLVSYKFGDSQNFIHCRTVTKESHYSEDKSEEVIKELREEFADDPTFVFLPPVRSLSDDTLGIDYELMEQMRALRAMCSLGGRVRADAKIRNRQPIRNAYVYFTESKARWYIDYIDRNEWCRKCLEEELNVFSVSFVEDTNKFFDAKLKPNFKSLGPKGYGKQAQGLKTFLADLSSEVVATILEELKYSNEPLIIQNVPLTLEDVEVEYFPKQGYAGSFDKIGSVILDLDLDQNLLMHGFIADLQSEIQTLRKEQGFKLTDLAKLTIFIDNMHDSFYTLLDNAMSRLKRECMLTDLSIKPMIEIDNNGSSNSAEKLEIDGTTVGLILEQTIPIDLIIET